MAPPGRVILPDDDFAPVILEVMAKRDVESFGAFKARVKANKPEMKGSLLLCKTVYGDHLTFDTGQRQNPVINGQPVDYAPPKVLESPFLDADYDSGVVTIRKDGRKNILDFAR